MEKVKPILKGADTYEQKNRSDHGKSAQKRKRLCNDRRVYRRRGEKGHSVTRFDAALKNVGGCHACETCFKSGKACSFDDDFNAIAPSIFEADVVVFTMPVYWYSLPAQIKGVIDKLFSFVVGGKDIAGKECALIACCEEDDMSVFDGVRVPVERSAALMKWKMAGEVLIPGVLNVGDIDKTDGCKQAAELADKI